VSGRKRELTADEKQLWRRVASGLKRRRRALPEPDAALIAEHKPRSRAQNPSPSPAPRTPAKLAPPPAERGAEKRVRRGKLEIGATLDLHGHTQVTGQAALERFLAAASARGDSTVIVVTGVGRAGEGVLKRRLPEWLASPSVRPMISGFAQAHQRHGGAGAYYVFIKRSRT
jgi:DNA-nicking Smr family endonuclease